MKHLETLVLAALVAALMATASAGSASATELTCGSSMCPVETSITGSSEGLVVFDPPFGKVECIAELWVKTFSTGGASETIRGEIVSFPFSRCGSNIEVFVLQEGSLEIHTSGSEANSNGVITSTGLELTITFFGTHCIFRTNENSLGTLTGSNNTKSSATLDISATISRTGGRSGAFCGSSMPLTGALVIFSPSALNVD